MSKKKKKESFEEQKEELLEAIDELRESLDLDDEDLDTIKEWGVAILVTGVSAFLIYQLINKVFIRKSKDEPIVESNDDLDIGDLLKQQLALFLTALAKKKLSGLFDTNEAQ